MPPANIIVFTDNMVTSSIGVQSACSSSSTYTNLQEENYDDICPSHFTDIHRTKLEDTFSRKQKPDDIQLQIIAMECNLLYKDVRDWFKARRIQWIEELVRSESVNCSNSSSSSRSYKNDTNNNYTTTVHDHPQSAGNNNTHNDPTTSTNGLVHSSHSRKHVTHHAMLYNKFNNNIESSSKLSKKPLTNNSIAHSANDVTT